MTMLNRITDLSPEEMPWMNNLLVKWAQDIVHGVIVAEPMQPLEFVGRNMDELVVKILLTIKSHTEKGTESRV